MDELKELRDLVGQLEGLKAPDDIKTKLQEVLKCFLNNYYIHYSAFKIEPVLIEIYYYNQECFLDEAVYSAKNDNSKATIYAKSRQQGNFGKMFLHYNDYGLDICLTDSKDYYLSVLIKNAIINNKLCGQREIGQMICKYCENYNDCKSINNCIHNNTIVLKKLNNPKKRAIALLQRKGLKTGFVDENFAACSVDEIKNDILSKRLTLATGFGKQWECAIVALSENDNEDTAKSIANELNGSVIEEKYFNCAKKCLLKK